MLQFTKTNHRWCSTGMSKWMRMQQIKKWKTRTSPAKNQGAV